MPSNSADSSINLSSPASDSHEATLDLDDSQSITKRQQRQQQQQEASEAIALEVSRDRGAQPAAPLSTTSSFWFNGSLTRAESVEPGDGGEKTWLAVPAASSSAWAQVDSFRVPCRFVGGDDLRQAADDGSAAFVKSLLIETGHAARHGPASETHGASSGCVQGPRDREWVSAVEETVAAHVTADAHRQLFSWADAGSHTLEDKVTSVPSPICDGNGERRDALLQWWCSHH